MVASLRAKEAGLTVNLKNAHEVLSGVMRPIIDRVPRDLLPLFDESVDQQAKSQQVADMTLATIAEHIDTLYNVVFQDYGRALAAPAGSPERIRLAELADRGEQLWYLSLMFWMLVALHMIGAAQMLAVPLEHVISAAAIWIAGIAASVGMAGFLLSEHPMLRKAKSW